MKTAIILAAITFFATACDESAPLRPELSAEQRALNEHIALWQRSNIASYQYIYRRLCFCPQEQDIVVIVVSGQVSQAFRSPAGTFLTASELANVFTVEGLFNKVQDAINQRVSKLTVTYNSQLGFPESISIDPIQNLADDETTYTARGFQ